MVKKEGKQMRVSEVQYEILGKISKELRVSRIEVLNNLVNLAKFIVDNKAKSVKVVGSDGVERDMYLSMLVGMSDE
jgi:hypothetical protein